MLFRRPKRVCWMSIKAQYEGNMSSPITETTTELTVRSTEPAPQVDQEIPENLKSRTAQGAMVSCLCQGINFSLRTGSMVILARLLAPEDFGLVGMVTALTGFLGLFKEAGLSTAAVQSVTITQEQLSMLFWINVAVSCALAVLCAAIAPAVAAFYSEPRLFWITVAAGASFVFAGLAAQHRTILLRSMRFPILATVDILSLVVSIVVSIGMAAAGYGYWALVASAVTLQAGSTIGVWLAAGWVPGRPRRHSGVRRMIKYGGTVTLNSIVVYLAYNADKVLLGRLWGAEALGIYGRAYQLINLPTDNLHSAIGCVAFPALSRVQGNPARLRRYFLRGYSLFLSVAIPITMACTLFASDIVRVFLGPKWQEAAGVFQLLTPTVLVFAVINPLGWLLFANGRVVRSLKIALLIAPVVVLAYLSGSAKGPSGVALGFSIAMVLLMVPIVLWAKHGTLITSRDIFRTVAHPAVSALVATAAALVASPWMSKVGFPLFRLAMETGVLFAVYFVVLLFVFGHKEIYLELLEHAKLWPARVRGTAGEND
jgi:O-antigen/teichoic acid export membrane protein